ncbi:MAG: hypothetical protein BGO49_24640 [Planctomycetales bacterium 71-10]|nr:MAG: hypothetical protein BGO49_24640 [Planctomycetales bacterium 71-10]
MLHTPHALHPLTLWRKANRYSHAGFAGLLAEKFPGITVSKQAVSAWEQLLARPTPDKIAAIEKLTDHEVLAEDFREYRGRGRPPRKTVPAPQS